MMKLLRKLFGIPYVAPHTVTVSFGVTHWYWHEKGANGEITCSSEAFDSKSNAERAARAHVAAQRVYVDG